VLLMPTTWRAGVEFENPGGNVLKFMSQDLQCLQKHSDSYLHDQSIMEKIY